MPKREFQGITKRSKSLWSESENIDYDLKRNMRGLHQEDLVAFANSAHGGAIFIGIDEGVTSDGTQNQEIVGCDIGDDEKLKILNKCDNCFPAINVDVYFENIGRTPFIRIEIPSSTNRPHCTGKGIYKTRGDGKNRALKPVDLLHLFLDHEGHEFVERFSSATNSLDIKLSQVFGDLLNRFAYLEGELRYELNEIKDSIDIEVDDIEEEVKLKLEEIEDNLTNEIGEIHENLLGESYNSYSDFSSRLDQLDSSINNLQNNIDRSVYDLNDSVQNNISLTEEFSVEILSQVEEVGQSCDDIQERLEELE